MTSKEQITAITNREIDIGFFRTPTPLKQSAINFTYLTEDALVVAMHAEHPLSRFQSLNVRALQDEPLIFFSRSEEHTSELQSLMRISYAVFCSKKKYIRNPHYPNQ